MRPLTPLRKPPAIGVFPSSIINSDAEGSSSLADPVKTVANTRDGGGPGSPRQDLLSIQTPRRSMWAKAFCYRLSWWR